jgi:Asp/Glu/hydantoin racemase
MSQTLTYIHTSHVLIPLFSELSKRELGGVAITHMVDESLIRNTIASGRLTKETIRRLVGMIGSAHDAGADAVMVTCSSIGPGVVVARALYDFPIFRVDEAMAEKAVSLGSRVGVAATLKTTLEPTVGLISETAAASKRQVEVIPALCEGAFEKVLAGDTATHDRMVADTLTGLMSQVDVIVLAQASMARVVESLSAQARQKPILSSPELAVQQVRQALLGGDPESSQSGATV